MSRAIRWDHLQFLVQGSQLPAVERDALAAKAESSLYKDRLEVLEKLESLTPGTARRLREIWEGRQSIFIWDVPWLEGRSSDEISEMLVKAIGSNAVSPDWSLEDGVVLRASQPASDEGDEDAEEAPSVQTWSVLRIRSSETLVKATIRVRKVQRVEREGEYRSVPASRDLDVALTLSSTRAGRRTQWWAPSVTAAGAYGDARQAVIAFMVWLRGVPIPTRMPDLRSYLSPILLLDGEVLAFARENGLVEVGIDGPDSHDVFGKVAYEGKPDGAQFHLGPLDKTDPRARDQHRAPQRIREFNFAHNHSDGFVERARVRFHFGRQTGLAFPVHTSQVAIISMARAVYKHVRPRS